MEWTPEGIVLVIGSLAGGLAGLFAAVRMSKCVKVKCCGCIEVDRDPVAVSRQPSEQVEESKEGSVMV
jgi:hypothetical protein